MLMGFKQICKVSMAAGAAVVMAMGAGLAPAQATNLKFSFTSDGCNFFECGNPGQGSFILDTSVADSDATNDQGFYENAIKDLTFNGSLSSTRNLETLVDGNGNTIFSLGEFSFPSSFLFGDYLSFAGLDPDQLSSNSEDYNNSFVGGRYASMNVVGLEVSDPTAVPEPTSAVSFVALGALSAGSLMKRKMKKTAC